jgi:hypothetical protein
MSAKPGTWRRLGLFTAALLLPSSPRLLAAVQTHAMLAQEGGESSVVAPSRSYTLDVFIVVALIGAALFVVCRSSRRM